jgi:hypothetical protein
VRLNEHHNIVRFDVEQVGSEIRNLAVLREEEEAHGIISG